MAARKQAYVYLVADGETPLYVGKGTGNRMNVSARRLGGSASVLEECRDETEAFKRERHWIAQLQPTENIRAGGNGGRCRRLRRAVADKVTREIERVGSQVFAARALCRKLDETNCEQWGVSKVDLFRLREVAHG
jgi:hypothetical protein